MAQRRFLFISFLFGLWGTSSGFVSFPATVSPSFSPSAAKRVKATTTTQLCAGLFGGNSGSGGGFLSNIFSSNEQGPKIVFDIPAKDVKIGALRFLLQIYLVAEQNKPEPNSWFTKQGEDGELNIYYKDGTGMVSLELLEYSIKAKRYGERPSLQYVLQESILLHGVLDELYSVAFEVSDIAEEKRLIRLNDDAAIEKAREKLPARKA